LKISIIIPVYNEEENITGLLEKLNQALGLLKYEYEVIFINDGSTDDTMRLLSEITKKQDVYTAIDLKRNFGQTAAIMAGIDAAKGDVIVTMDGDLQNDPANIPLLLEKLEQGYDVCSGWRKNRKDNYFSRTLPSKIANYIISTISGVKLNDYGCTLKAYKKDVLKNVKLYGEMHRFIPIYASWDGARVTEIPVTHHPRKYGNSKYGLERTFKVVLDLIVVKYLAKYSQKPIYLFGGFGLLNFFLSIFCFALMVYFKFLGEKSFIQTPLPLLVVLFMLMGFIAVLMGLVAEMLMRTYYESQGKATYTIKKER
jgi:glycosyltransferase involved in cell wall biosynthesis